MRQLEPKSTPLHTGALGVFKNTVGGSSSGKTADFDSAMHRFDPYTPCQIFATVTQLDRVLGYELRSREFESLRSHQVLLNMR